MKLSHLRWVHSVAVAAALTACANDSERQSDRGKRLDARDLSPTPFPSPSASDTITAEPIAPIDPVATVKEIAKSFRIVGLEDEPRRIPLVIDESVQKFISVSVQIPPRLGSVETTETNVLTYVPKPDFFGDDQFKLTVRFTENNAVKAEATSTVEITLTPVNDFPTAINTSLNVGEDASVNFQLLASDIDSDPLKFEIIEAPRGGVIENFDANNGKGKYTPKPNQNGNDFFKFQVIDPGGAKSVALGLINLNEANDAPVGVAQSVRTNEDLSVNIQLRGNDVDSANLTYKVVGNGGATKGTISGLNAATGELAYTPNANANGTDQFSFVVSDGQVDSAPVVVPVTIIAVNDPPVLGAAAAQTTPEDTSRSFTLSLSDIDSAAADLKFEVVSAGKGDLTAVLSSTQAVITYTPHLNANGLDTVQYRISDGAAVSMLQSTDITITAVNDAPIALSSVLNAGNRLTAITGMLSASDIESVDSSLVREIVSQPANGTVTIQGTNFTYVVNRLVANDSFVFRVRDASNAFSNNAVVQINLSQGNLPPVTNDQVASVAEDGTVTFRLLATDGNLDPVLFELTQEAANGTSRLNRSTGDVTYVPNPNFNGTDTIRFTATDGIATSSPKTVTITVTPVNDPPTLSIAGVFTIAEDSPATVIPLLMNDIDNPAQAFTFTLPAGSRSARGTLTVVSGSLRYQPDLDYFGVDAFSIRISDGMASSAELSVIVNITPVNDAPVTANLVFNTPEDMVLSGLVNGTDVDGDQLTLVKVTNDPNWVVTPSTRQFSYTPAANFAGAVVLSYSLSDGVLSSAVRTITINVGAVNDAPVASSGSIQGDEDTTISGTLVAVDPDSGLAPSQFFISRAPSNGTVSLVGSNFVYRGNANFFGVDDFQFAAADGQAISNFATITVTVAAVNDAPMLSPPFIIRTNEDEPKTVTIAVSDIDSPIPSLYLVSSSSVGGTVAVNGLTVNYVPSPNFSGEFSFVLRAWDSSNAFSSQESYSILVAPINDVPTVAAETFYVGLESRSLNGQLVGVDNDRDPLTFTKLTEPTSGTVVVNSNGQFTYVPNSGFVGEDLFTYSASDGLATSPSGRAKITVKAVNDGPTANPVTVNVQEDGQVVFNLSGSDPENGALQFFAQAPSRGSLMPVGVGTSEFRYVPNANFNGTDSFSYAVSDGNSFSVPATVSITVQAVNDAPTIANFASNGQPNAVQRFKPVTGDVDGDPLTLSIVEPLPQSGVASIDEEGFVVYEPAPGFVAGTDMVTVRVSDGQANATATGSFTVGN